MCLGIPGKVVKVNGEEVLVDFGGVRRKVISPFEEVSPGDYVIVHVGMVISKMDEKEALETLKLFKEIENALYGS